jgi:hypothetical protein
LVDLESVVKGLLVETQTILVMLRILVLVEAVVELEVQDKVMLRAVGEVLRLKAL